MTFPKHFTTYFVAPPFFPEISKDAMAIHIKSSPLFFSTNSVAMAGQKTLQLFILFMVLILLMEEAKLIDARRVRSRKRRSNYKPKKPSITELAKKVQELEDRLAEIEECKRKSDILH